MGLETSAHFKPKRITGVHPTVLPTGFPQVNPLTPTLGRVFAINPSQVPLRPRRCPGFGFLLCRAADPGGPGQPPAS